MIAGLTLAMAGVLLNVIIGVALRHAWRNHRRAVLRRALVKHQAAHRRWARAMCT